jgi:ATP-dependent 26S proteasome regulatory subunit
MDCSGIAPVWGCGNRPHEFEYACRRTNFLNELDGFAANIGIVTLATTNHPERLDPAILDRPSRFDRKYPFDLPEQPERHAYIVMWNK